MIEAGLLLLLVAGAGAGVFFLREAAEALFRVEKILASPPLIIIPPVDVVLPPSPLAVVGEARACRQCTGMIPASAERCWHCTGLQ